MSFVKLFEDHLIFKQPSEEDIALRTGVTKEMLDYDRFPFLYYFSNKPALFKYSETPFEVGGFSGEFTSYKDRTIEFNISINSRQRANGVLEFDPELTRACEVDFEETYNSQSYSSWMERWAVKQGWTLGQYSGNTYNLDPAYFRGSVFQYISFKDPDGNSGMLIMWHIGGDVRGNYEYPKVYWGDPEDFIYSQDIEDSVIVNDMGYDSPKELSEAIEQWREYVWFNAPKFIFANEDRKDIIAWMIENLDVKLEELHSLSKDDIYRIYVEKVSQGKTMPISPNQLTFPFEGRVVKLNKEFTMFGRLFEAEKENKDLGDLKLFGKKVGPKEKHNEDEELTEGEKTYIGSQEDKHFYLVKDTMDGSDAPKNLRIVDAEGGDVINGREKYGDSFEPTKVADFLAKELPDLNLTMLEYHFALDSGLLRTQEELEAGEKAAIEEPAQEGEEAVKAGQGGGEGPGPSARSIFAPKSHSSKPGAQDLAGGQVDGEDSREPSKDVSGESSSIFQPPEGKSFAEAPNSSQAVDKIIGEEGSDVAPEPEGPAVPAEPKETPEPNPDMTQEKGGEIIDVSKGGAQDAEDAEESPKKKEEDEEESLEEARSTYLRRKYILESRDNTLVSSLLRLVSKYRAQDAEIWYVNKDSHSRGLGHICLGVNTPEFDSVLASVAKDLEALLKYSGFTATVNSGSQCSNFEIRAISARPAKPFNTYIEKSLPTGDMDERKAKLAERLKKVIKEA